MQKVVIKRGKAVYIDLSPEEEAAHLAEMAANQPTAEELAAQAAATDAPITARQWFNDNPNAKLIWSMTVAEVVAEIAALIDISFPPPATAATRTKWKLLLTAITLVVRIWVKRERLD